MAHVPTKNDDQYSDKETARRRDAVIKRMLATPPKTSFENEGWAEQDGTRDQK
jgi:hypothetical protein